MTNTFHGSQAVPSGYYLNTSSWAIEPVATDGARLPAGPGAWRRVPTLAALLATPVLGLAFLLFLPVIGFVLTLRAAVTPLVRLVSGSAGSLAITMSPGWQPGEAHFTGRRDRRHGLDRQEPPADDGASALDALQQEIERKRTRS